MSINKTDLDNHLTIDEQFAADGIPVENGYVIVGPRVRVGDEVTCEYPLTEREEQRGKVTRIYERKSRWGTTEMARVHWRDGHYSAVSTDRLIEVGDI